MTMTLMNRCAKPGASQQQFESFVKPCEQINIDYSNEEVIRSACCCGVCKTDIVQSVQCTCSLNT